MDVILEQAINNERSLRAWRWFFGLLSLDLSQSFLPELGLGNADLEPVKKISREFVATADELLLEDPDIVYGEGRATRALQHVLEELSTGDSTDLSRRVMELAEVDPAQEELASQGLWTMAMRRFSREGRPQPPITPSKIGRIEDSIRSFMQECDRASDRLPREEGLPGQIRLPISAPLTEWDRGVLSWEMLPFTYARTLLFSRIFRSFWARIKEDLTDYEIDALVRWARSFLPPVTQQRLSHPT